MPLMRGGHKMLCVERTSFSKTFPNTSPPLITSPSLKFIGVYWYEMSWAVGGGKRVALR